MHALNVASLHGMHGTYVRCINDHDLLMRDGMMVRIRVTKYPLGGLRNGIAACIITQASPYPTKRISVSRPVLCLHY